MSCSSQACKLSVFYGFWMVMERNLLCRQAASFAAVVPVHDRIIHVFVCIDLLFQHPRGGVLFGIQMQCLVVHPSGARNCEWSQVLRYEGLLLTNKAGCGEAVCPPGAKAAWYADVGLSCRWKLRQHPWTMESIWGHRAWKMLVILRWSWNRRISKHQLLLAWEKAIIFVVHIKVPNYPSTIQKPFKHLLGPFCDMMNNYTNLHHLTQNESFTFMISYQSVKDSNEIHTSMVILDAFNWFSHGIGDLCCQTCSEYCCETLGSKQTNKSFPSDSCFWRTGCFIGKFGTAFWECDTVTCFELFGWAETSGRRVLHYLSMQTSHPDHRLMSEDAWQREWMR